MTLTLNYLLELEEYAKGLTFEPKKTPCLIMHASIWRKAREQKCCEYTDEEFNTALNGNGIIKKGMVLGAGFMGGWGEVMMVIDMLYPTLENAKEGALQMEYKEKLTPIAGRP
ncbi:MAG: hypothetical protein IMZ53_01430 [Thermoplasmata archaeon]|nr:hypothetical protein [Thermoplasmata archaeon]MBE3139224.1 hypothetical protein [Thermoplasmata archaeon]